MVSLLACTVSYGSSTNHTIAYDYTQIEACLIPLCIVYELDAYVDIPLTAIEPYPWRPNVGLTPSNSLLEPSELAIATASYIDLS